MSIFKENILNDFGLYLGFKKFSPSTKKNYLSDIRLFLSWLTSKYPRIQLTEIDRETIKNYLAWLQARGKSPSSINRTLAALRQFFSFARQQQWVISNPAKKINNITNLNKSNQVLTKANKSLNKIIKKFAADLKKAGLSERTVKNYLSDIQCFTDWLIKNHQQ